eukprot:jgi/Ulvmu1/11093/UM070_0008.1
MVAFEAAGITLPRVHIAPAQSSSTHLSGRLRLGSSYQNSARPQRVLVASIACSHQRPNPLGAARNATQLVLKRMRRANETVKHLSCGAISAIVSRTVVAPLERVKMEVILNQQHRNQWPAAVGHIWTSGGWRNFWQGNMLNCMRTAPFKAVNYTAFDYLNTAICRWRGVSGGGGYERFLAGAGAGMFATVTCMPLDIVRTRMMSPRHAKSLPRTVLDMVAQEGLGAFYTGCLPALVSMAVGGATFYGTYDFLKSKHLIRQGIDPLERDDGEHKMRLGTAATLLYGALAGLCAETVTYPLEVIRRKMQLERVLAAREIAANPAAAALAYAGRASFRRRLAVAVHMSTKEFGLRGLYAGIAPNALQVLPSAALGYYVYEVMRVVLDVRA